MAARPDAFPEEILLMRRWLSEVFSQASQGLPWPQQASLRLIEQALAMGMFGGLLSSAWLLQEFRARSSDPNGGPDLTHVMNALQQAALGPLPLPVAEAMHVLMRAIPPQGAAGPITAMQDMMSRAVADLKR
ncbi:MAG: hypothetical protein JWM80_1741 [Cyanobacteria bacterium RYN_339]|nr:hypothetical protein [Cyanobacteria bacterium RYN_339]